ncbi:hypothetical protein KFL_001420175 [Klebsormidium nitens]|uniref:DNA (cytosine-5-)-methyltransferase n=1 Tax=Klebsormidium nitens TaxID=105231 RepID=A0A1Y1HZY7_KLENI|nr:hypothetical protein KFL_001420175 [Klebsormidium nitens]|eukprot:GAQ83292.1 hypothetical protein KFL_001420175 [Klebsormidium nitens]
MARDVRACEVCAYPDLRLPAEYEAHVTVCREDARMRVELREQIDSVRDLDAVLDEINQAEEAEARRLRGPDLLSSEAAPEDDQLDLAIAHSLQDEFDSRNPQEEADRLIAEQFAQFGSQPMIESDDDSDLEAAPVADPGPSTRQTNQRAPRQHGAEANPGPSTCGPNGAAPRQHEADALWTDGQLAKPMFLFENVVNAPRGTWRIIEKELELPAEALNSDLFSACQRARKYVHNLPPHPRTPVPDPRKELITMQSVLPPSHLRGTPPWDKRKKLRCINTQTIWPRRLAFLNNELATLGEAAPPAKSLEMIAYHNLAWVAGGRLRRLEAREIETVMGFPEDHTACFGSSVERVKALGESFQVDTVMHLLSPLRGREREAHPDGLSVLSLFDGIGAAAVALDRLGIKVRRYWTSEINADAQEAVSLRWRSNEKPPDALQRLGDVTTITDEKLRQMVDEEGGIDLIVGGSPCNNLTGSNRVCRDGLEGVQSKLFYEYVRIVQTTMRLYRHFVPSTAAHSPGQHTNRLLWLLTNLTFWLVKEMQLEKKGATYRKPKRGSK